MCQHPKNEDRVDPVASPVEGPTQLRGSKREGKSVGELCVEVDRERDESDATGRLSIASENGGLSVNRRARNSRPWGFYNNHGVDRCAESQTESEHRLGERVVASRAKTLRGHFGLSCSPVFRLLFFTRFFFFFFFFLIVRLSPGMTSIKDRDNSRKGTRSQTLGSASVSSLARCSLRSQLKYVSNAFCICILSFTHQPHGLDTLCRYFASTSTLLFTSRFQFNSLFSVRSARYQTLRRVNR